MILAMLGQLSWWGTRGAAGMPPVAEAGAEEAVGGRLAIFHGYMLVFVVAFVVSLAATPIARRIALMYGVVDRPSVARKVHRAPVAYLGGVGVLCGLIAAIFFVYTNPLHGLIQFHQSAHMDGASGYLRLGMPLSIVGGMCLIAFIGLLDDAKGIDPRAKIAGQLIATAALAIETIGVKVAAGVMLPIAKAVGIGTVMMNGSETIGFHIPLPMVVMGTDAIPVDIVYWVGTAVLAAFVLGACNASNLIDGLDGLLAGTTAISAAGLLVIALGLAAIDDGPLDGARVILCLAVLGACMGFLPHNFNPATIFLGDCGSLLLGYCTIVIILTLGDTGRTHLVLAGLIIYAVPILDTALAIIRRKASGKKMSDADDQHLHHMLKRSLGVKGAVLALYGLAAVFAVIGVLLSEGRGRVIYAIAMVIAAYVGVTAYKIARKEALDAQAAACAGGEKAAGAGPRTAGEPGHQSLVSEKSPASPPTEISMSKVG